MKFFCLSAQFFKLKYWRLSVKEKLKISAIFTANEGHDI
jgi:hypothetical protein